MKTKALPTADTRCVLRMSSSPGDSTGSAKGHTMEYELIKRIGQGTFAQVFRAKVRASSDQSQCDADSSAQAAQDSRTSSSNDIAIASLEAGQDVAVKKIRKDEGRGGPGHSARKLAQREVEALRRLNVHPNVVQLLDVYEEGGRMHLVMPLCKWDLEAVIKDQSVTLNLPEVKCYSLGILKGLAHCHEHGILHRDIKPNNVLVGYDGHIKLCDLGSSREQQVEKGKMTRQTITQHYRPPELIFGLDPYTTKVDVWSAACVIAEMLRRAVLFEGRSDIDQLSKIFSVLGVPTEENWPSVKDLPFFFPFKPSAQSQSLKLLLFSRENLNLGAEDNDSANEDDIKSQIVTLLEKMLIFDPEQRLSAAAAAQDPLFTSLPVPTPVQQLMEPKSLESAVDGDDGVSLSSSSLSSWGG